jgi:hypothetical protein
MDTGRAFDHQGVSIAQLEELALQMGTDVFLASYGDPYLVSLADLAGVYDTDPTELTKIETPRGLLGALKGARAIPSQARAWAVRKHQSAFPAKITLGRANNNDIAIPHRSISKFHAYFTPRETHWTITEAGSKNASRHNGVRITHELAPRPVNDRDVLQFGAGPEMLWVHGATLLQLLAEQRADA